MGHEKRATQQTNNRHAHHQKKGCSHHRPKEPGSPALAGETPVGPSGNGSPDGPIDMGWWSKGCDISNEMPSLHQETLFLRTAGAGSYMLRDELDLLS